MEGEGTADSSDDTDEAPVGLDCVRPHLNPQVRWKTRQRNVGEPGAFIGRGEGSPRPCGRCG